MSLQTTECRGHHNKALKGLTLFFFKKKRKFPFLGYLGCVGFAFLLHGITMWQEGAICHRRKWSLIRGSRAKSGLTLSYPFAMLSYLTRFPSFLPCNSTNGPFCRTALSDSRIHKSGQKRHSVKNNLLVFIVLMQHYGHVCMYVLGGEIACPWINVLNGSAIILKHDWTFYNFCLRTRNVWDKTQECVVVKSESFVVFCLFLFLFLDRWLMWSFSKQEQKKR